MGGELEAENDRMCMRLQFFEYDTDCASPESASIVGHSQHSSASPPSNLEQEIYETQIQNLNAEISENKVTIESLKAQIRGKSLVERRFGFKTLLKKWGIEQWLI